VQQNDFGVGDYAHELEDLGRLTKIVQACPAIYLAAAEDRASSGRPLAFIRLSRADSSIEDKALGRRFVQTVETTALEIQADPLRWRVFDGRVRRCLVPRFP
jgi:hypothetical protein